MTTPRDLMITAMDVAPSPPVAGELSLALAGAELIDLLAAEVIRLEDDRIVPAHRPALADRLLDQAATSLTREPPYETVADWLWRRGRGLAPAYLTALEADGQLTRQRRRRLPFRTGRMVPADTPDRRQAADRWASHEPVLTALATAVGIPIRDKGDKETEEAPGTTDDATETVVVAVNEALIELEAVRQRRSIEQAAFDNIWRGN
ncbi:GPP34 family phosphoprotein [Streptomyces scopuliridis]|uniref:GPP34 family phosphoprotein n=1 Tax=Streptomyces scopuliridis TaxID=452529 RepID=A0ACD4ZLM2_9ACTN|nr:GPP34 family phosphoprotein [Streptomyces scopuliridis]WSB34650.1 GPP34 family phosphoprotein [Streptomyces scopuliridis]WSB98898.1 GPP34 family phosphoprotein [Streptomyces scopuliridis]WSC07400.1 GPP34 family phosphoprotein [Streptomyces scopuliridis]